MSRTVALLFFLSGLAALLYEILWVRGIGSVLGASSAAVATVVAAYLTGLALGAWAAGHLGLGQRRGLRTYAVLELGIAATAPFVPAGVAWLDSLALDPTWERLAGLGLLVPARFLVVLAVAVVPTALMGATLPVLCTALSRSLPRPGAVIGWLYGLNTLGGVAGCLLAGFLFIETFGMRTSLGAAAVLNLALMAAALFLDRRGLQQRSAPVQDAVRPRRPASLPRALVLLAVLVSSFVSIGLEILWTRWTALAVGGTTYAFSLVLAVFLVGLGAGSLVLGALMRRWSLGAGTFGLLQAVTGLMVLLSVGHYDALAEWVGLWLYETRGSFFDRAMGSLVACTLLSAAPSFLLGFSFPLLSELWIRRPEEIGRGVGLVYVVSTAGGVLGSALTAFALAPRFGLERSFLLLGFLTLSLGCLALLFAERGRLPATLGAAAALLAGLALFAGHNPLGFTWLEREDWDQRRVYLGVSLYGEEALASGRQTLWTRDGPASSVAVFEIGGGRELAVNGKVDASTSGDMATQLWLAYLPQLLHGAPEDVFVLGYGAGVTAGAAARFGSRVVCAEIEQGVLDASPFFQEVNFGAHENPQVELVADDGRALLRRREQTYDVITTEPSNPWMAGMAGLFTREFYELCAARLRAGGILCQWVHLYWMAPEDYRAIAASVHQVFPHVAVFRTQPADRALVRSAGDTLLLASREPLDLSFRTLAQRLTERAALLGDLRDASPLLTEEPDWVAAYLAALLVAGGEDLGRYCAGAGRALTDDHPFLEFSAARRMHESHGMEIVRGLLEARRSRDYGDEEQLPLPQRAWLRFYRGAEYLAHNLDARAQPLLEDAFRLQPDLANLALPRWVCALRLGEPAALGEGLQQVLKDSPESMLRVAEELSRAGHTEAALAVLQRAQRTLGVSASLSYTRGRVLQRAGREAEAKTAFIDAVRRDPRHRAAAQALADLEAEAR